MNVLEVKNQVLDVLKQDNIANDQKISALKVLLSDKHGKNTESKAKELLQKYTVWDDYVKNLLSDPVAKINQPTYYNFKYFDLIKFYYLHHDQFDKLTDQQIRDGVLEIKKLRDITVREKKTGAGSCRLFDINVTLGSVPDSNQTMITFNRLIAVLGYLNAVRGIKAESSLSMQINWMCCSEKVRERKHLFFHGCEDLLASIAMGSGADFDSDDIAFLYGGTILMSYLSYCNTERKCLNSDGKIMLLEAWMKLPADKYSFKGKYPDLVQRVEFDLNDEGRDLIRSILRNAIVMLKNSPDKRSNYQGLFASPFQHPVYRGGHSRPRGLKNSFSTLDLRKK